MGGVHLKPRRLGEKLREIRLALELSQSELLRRLGFEDDIWYTQISAYENGSRQPPLLILLEYARIANISTDILIDDGKDLPGKLTNARRHRR